MKDGLYKSLGDTRQVGIAVRIRTQDGTANTNWFISGARIAALTEPVRGSMPRSILNFPSVFNRFIDQGYRHALKLNDESISKLDQINTFVENRSFYSAITFEGVRSEKEILRDTFEPDQFPSTDSHESSQSGRISQKYLDSMEAVRKVEGDDLTLIGGLRGAVSTSLTEPLPCELGRSNLNDPSHGGYRIPRHSRKKRGIVELGRLYVNRDQSGNITAEPITPMMMRHLLSGIVGTDEFDTVVIEVPLLTEHERRLDPEAGVKNDKEHAGFREMGFRLIPGSEKAHYQKERYVILKAKLTDALKAQLRRQQ